MHQNTSSNPYLSIVDTDAGMNTDVDGDISPTQGAASLFCVTANASSPLAKPSATREILERHGLHLKKSLGQNFLVNDDVIRKIIELSGVNADDAVLEIGPGIGTLTYALLVNASSVVAIERDPKLPEILNDTLAFAHDRLTLIEGDAVDVVGSFDPNSSAIFSSYGYDGALPTKLISNLPYAVAATVVLDVFANMPSVESATVMVQREVAERMRAVPGTKNYGAYTVKLAFYAEYVDSFNVAPSNFMPPPHVESTVIRLDRRSGYSVALSDTPLDGTNSTDIKNPVDSGSTPGASSMTPSVSSTLNFSSVLGVSGAPNVASSDLIKTACIMADAAFFARRKTIANSMRQYFAGRNKSVVEMLPQIFAAAGISPSVRGETLTPDDYLNLARAFVGCTAE